MKKILSFLIICLTFVLLSNKTYSQKIIKVNCNWCGSSIKINKSKDTNFSDNKTTFYKYEYLNGFGCGGGLQNFSKLVREYSYLLGNNDNFAEGFADALFKPKPSIENAIKNNSYCTKKCYFSN